jgi:tetratricopeptide (TPR) repeat protein
MKNLLILGLVLSGVSAAASPFQDSSDIFYQKGLEEKSAKRYMVASKHFDKAISINPKFTQAYLENGYVNLEMRRSEIAKMNFTKVTELDPANIQAMKELVQLFYSHHQYQKAIDLALKCKACGNNDRIIALSYYHLEDYGNAEKGLVAVLAKDPSDALAAYTLGRTYMEMELEAKAITWYQKAVALDPSKAGWAQELGLLYFNAGNFKNAVIYFTKAAENGFTQSNDFKENLGFAHFYSRDFEKGEKVLGEVLAKKPGNKDILRDLAQGFYDYKMYDKSLEYCQRLMEMDMKDGQALYQAGLCFQKKGQKEKGQAMCDKAIELDPSLNNLRKQQMLAAGL